MIRTAIAVAVLLLVSSVSLADDPATLPSRAMHLNATSDVPFPAGTVVAVGWAAYTPPIRYSSDHLVDASAGVGYYFWDNNSLNIIATGLHADQLDGDTAEGTSLSLIGRWHFFNRDPFTAYIDGGIGYSWWNSPMPEYGTTYDWNPRLGVGLGWRITDSTYLTTGARYIHFSNARVHGPDKNPGYDGIECYVGVIVKLN